jgi:hypothetical protein
MEMQNQKLMPKKDYTSVKAFTLFSLILVCGFAAGVALSCKAPDKDSNCTVLISNGETIQVGVGDLIKIQEIGIGGDTITIERVSEDDAKAFLEEHGQG